MGASDLHLWWSVYDYTSPSASESRARQTRDMRYWSVWVLVQFLQAGPGLAIPPFTLSSWLTVWWIGKGRALLRGARSSLPDWWKGARLLEEGALKFAWLMERGVLTWGGHAQVCLIDGKGRAHLRRARSRKMALFTIGNLLIQHTVSRWCSSGCVHEGCGGVDHWLQTEDWALPGFLL